jgi:hypothetical protein
MRKAVFRRKPFVVDGQDYLASLTATIDESVELTLTVQAGFGHRSLCTIRGLRNFAYYYNYGYWNRDDYSEEEQTVKVTPRMVAGLIRFARHNGWSPEHCASNFQLAITNIEAKAMLDAFNAAEHE